MGFSLPPLQAQNTGIQNSSGFQNQIAPPGQSLNDIRMQQQYTGFNGPQNPNQNMGMMNQPQNFGQFNNGVQNGFQYPMQTGMQPGMPQQQQQNGFSSFNPPPVPPILQQNTIAPLVPQKTGPPPPVRFGVTGDAKKLMPQATGRRANLSQATPQNPFGF